MPEQTKEQKREAAIKTFSKEVFKEIVSRVPIDLRPAVEGQPDTRVEAAHAFIKAASQLSVFAAKTHYETLSK